MKLLDDRSIIFGLLYSTVSLLLVSGQASEVREFTSSDGKKLSAEVVAVFNQTSVIRSNGREFAIPFSRLSDADRSYLEDWAKNNANQPTSLFQVTLTPKLEGKKEDKGSNMTVETEHWIYEITVLNKLPESFDGIRLESAVHVFNAHESADEEKPIFMFSGLVDQTIALSDKPTVLKTNEINIMNSKDDSGKRRVDKLIGIWVRVLQNNRIIAEKKSDAKELIEAEWPFSD